MSMETAEKTLPKHLNTAVNAIQKQIDKYAGNQGKLLRKAADLREQAAAYDQDIKGLQEQIAKLKGE